MIMVTISFGDSDGCSLVHARLPAVRGDMRPNKYRAARMILVIQITSWSCFAVSP